MKDTWTAKNDEVSSQCNTKTQFPRPGLEPRLLAPRTMACINHEATSKVSTDKNVSFSNRRIFSCGDLD